VASTDGATPRCLMSMPTIIVAPLPHRHASARPGAGQGNVLICRDAGGAPRRSKVLMLSHMGTGLQSSKTSSQVITRLRARHRGSETVEHRELSEV
jgi:hypothetical protein